MSVGDTRRGGRVLEPLHRMTMARRELKRLIGGYATGTLTARERRALFEAALEDQELFDSLADEEALKELLDDPASRQRLLETLGEESRWTLWSPKLAVLLRRPWRLTVAGGLAAAALGVLIVVGIQRESSRQTGNGLPVSKAGKDLEEAAREPLSLGLSAPEEKAQQPEFEKQDRPPPSSPRAESRGPSSRKKQAAALTLASPAVPGAARGLFFGSRSSTADETLLRDRAGGRTALEKEKSPAEPLRRILPDAAPKEASARPLGLRYAVLIREPAGGFVEAQLDRPFAGLDRVRLSFEPNQDGYLYVLQNEGGNWSVLFPPQPSGPQDSEIAARVKTGDRYSVPSRGALGVAALPRLVVVFSRLPMAQLEGPELDQADNFEQGKTDGLENRLKRRRAERANTPLIVETVELKTRGENAAYLVHPNPSSESTLVAELLFEPTAR